MGTLRLNVDLKGLPILYRNGINIIQIQTMSSETLLHLNVHCHLLLMASDQPDEFCNRQYQFSM